MEEYANLIIGFIAANGVAIATFVINMITVAVKNKRASKKSPSYANVELELMKINARLDQMEKKDQCMTSTCIAIIVTVAICACFTVLMMCLIEKKEDDKDEKVECNKESEK